VILIKPSFEIEQFYDRIMLTKIEQAGRTCYKSTSPYTRESSSAFVRKIVKSGHESVLEHEKISIRIICDRGISHELVRHRLASFSQASTRYIDSTKEGCHFVIPPWVGIAAGIYHAKDCNQQFKGLCEADTRWFDQMLGAENVYTCLHSCGWSPQQARSVLPNSTKTELVMTCNLREWRHFFKLRTAPAAHPQMREIAIPMLVELIHKLPEVFEDIEVTTGDSL